MAPNSKKTMFNRKWAEIEELSWVSEDKSSIYYAYCSKCKRSFSLSNMGIQALYSHRRSQKHIQRDATKSNLSVADYLIKNSSTLPIEKPVIPMEVPTETTVNTNIHMESNIQRPISSFVERDQVTRSEILWALHCVASHVSMSAGGKSIETMKLMFPDSKIALNLKLQRNKLTYLIVYGLSKFFKNKLLDDIQKSHSYTVSFDESLNKISQKTQMDVIIRYWSQKNGQVVDSYLSSAFLGRATAIDIQSCLLDIIKPLDTKKIIQISMDGPNVNLKLLNDLNNDLQEHHDPSDPMLLNLGTCGLHNIHNAFKYGVKAAKWGLVEFLRALYNLFKNVPARRADFIQFTGSNKFPKKFCAIRWLNNVDVAERAEEILPFITLYTQEAKKNKREPSSYSYNVVLSGINDKCLGPKLAFFRTIAEEVEPFLRSFQSESPMAPFLYTDILWTLNTVMRRFIKKDILDSTVLTKIDIMKPNNIVGAKNVNLGYATRQALRSCQLNDKDILLFRTECLMVLQQFCQKLLTKSPLNYKLVKSITFCDPAVMTASIKNTLSRLMTTLEIFVDSRWLSSNVADRIENELSALMQKSTFLEVAKLYSRETRLDHFWSNAFLINNISENSIAFIKKICTLSHGNASVERGFSVNKECLIDNLKEESLVGQRIVWSAIKLAGGLENIEISKEMILCVRNARSYYMETLEQKKKEEKELEIAKQKNKRSAEELKELKEKKKQLLETTQKAVEQIDSEIKLLKP